MQILITGVAGFIGAQLAQSLLAQGHSIIGIDNFNDYYTPQLKRDRLSRFENLAGFQLFELDVADRSAMTKLFAEHHFDRVIHLAAQAGVRYSLENPAAYIDANLVGMGNVLEGCRQSQVAHLVFASSSSVYGMNAKVPFSERDGVDHPVSLYAATKKSNELMAHSYAHLYDIPVTGLRFFTVYGPWGRPDMAPFLFTDAILKQQPIKVFNKGQMQRDFTYIDDIVEGVVQVLDKAPVAQPGKIAEHPGQSWAPYQILNIGNNQPIELMRFIKAIESAAGAEAEKQWLPMQPGDVPRTFADVSSLEQLTGFKPKTSIEEGMRRTVEWYRDYYQC